MTETLFTVINSTDVVENVIVASQKFIDSLPGAIASPDIDTGTLSAGHRYVEITKHDPLPGVGWKQTKGKFVPPPEPKLTPEEIKAQQEAEAHAAALQADTEFRIAMQDKLRAGGKLTQDERDRLLALSA